MVSGCTSGSAYKIGGGFDFVCQQLSWPVSGGTAWCITAYCAELGAYFGTYSYQGKRANYAAAGGIVSLADSTGANVGTSVNWGADSITITPCNFIAVSTNVSGNGSVTAGGTVYGGRYRIAGTAIQLTVTPATGYSVKKVLVNGTELSAPYTISNPQDDIAIVAYFAPSHYTVNCATPSGGTVSFTKNGNSVTPPFTANENDIITCTATPNADKAVQNFALDGVLIGGGSTGPQAFSFTIYEKTDSASYNCAVTFCDRTAVSDSVVGKSNGTTDDATVTTGGASVTRSATGAFLAYVGNTYIATAASPTNFRTFLGWVNANGDTLSEGSSYSWTQGSASVAIVASYVDKPLYTENFYIGTSTSDYGSGSTAVVAGCDASITRPEGTTKDGKWLGGTRTVTATTTPSGWTFLGAYVSDTSASGGTRIYKANGASSVTFESACDANIYALFANGSSVDPADADQGNSIIATGQAAVGLWKWEGGSTALEFTWTSKMYISSAPIAFSCARVYADGYSVSGTDDVKLRVLAFQSPDSTDSTTSIVTARKQDAFRLPMRRAEKYVEISISARHEVSQVAIATSMEALWQ